MYSALNMMINFAQTLRGGALLSIKKSDLGQHTCYGPFYETSQTGP